MNWQVGGNLLREDLDRTQGKKTSQDRGERAEDQALGEEFLHDPCPAGAECSAHCNFALPCRGSNEEEIGYVDAGYEPKHTGCR